MKKILVADDEKEIVEVIAMRLEAGGYEAVKAYDSLQAVRLAHETKPDLIILDIRMPPGTGIAVFENLKMSSFTSKTPVIFITAYPSDDIRKEVLEKGAADFIAKPFESQELLNKVKKLLGG
jgi:DNA-binding response OmpR family regulator